MSTNQLVASIEETPGRKISILLVDSAPAWLGGNSQLRQEFEVVQAATDSQAWDFLARHGAGLVLYGLDIHEKSHLELLKRLRGADDKTIRQIPFIPIINGTADQALISQLMQNGATDVITQPFDNQSLTSQIHRYSGRPHPIQTAPPPSPVVMRLEGYKNQSQFIHDLRKELSFAIRNKNELALMLLKLDQFEAVLEQGDEKILKALLTTASEIIQEHSHFEDKLAYFGDGIFAILLPAANVIGTRYLGKRLLSDFMAKQFRLGSMDMSLSVSIGVSAPEIKPGTTFSEILGLAENRLHAAIEAGGKRVVDHDTPSIATLSTQGRTDGSILRQIPQTQAPEKPNATALIRESRDSQSPEIQTWRNQARALEQENHRLQTELQQAQSQLQEMTELKNRLQLSDSQQQETLLSLEQLKAELERMKIRAASAEFIQDKLLSAEQDQEIIQQHMLEEYEKLQLELADKNNRIMQAESKYHKTEQQLTYLQHQLEVQKHEFEFALQDERTTRIKAEEALEELKQKSAREADLDQRPKFSPTPSIQSPPAKAMGPTQPLVKKLSPQPQPRSQATLTASPPSPRYTAATGGFKTSSPWPFRLAMVAAAAIVAGTTITFKETLLNKLPLSPTSIAPVNGAKTTAPLLQKHVVSAPKSSGQARPSETGSIEAAEKRLRDAAEMEFQHLLYQQADVKLSISEAQSVSDQTKQTHTPFDRAAIGGEENATAKPHAESETAPIQSKNIL